MNLTRYSRQLFPLIMGNTRTFFLGLQLCSQTGPKKNAAEGKKKVNLEENPYYAKYADKIKKLKETDCVEFNRRMQALSKIKFMPGGQDDDELVQTKPTNTKKRVSSTDDSSMGLDTIMKVNLLQDKSAAEIEDLWKNYYKNRDAVYAVIPCEKYRAMEKLLECCPLFLYPIPRKDGYEMFLGHFSQNRCRFTSLLNYQRHGENAPVQFVLHYFTEFLDSKGIVLMSGNVIEDGVTITNAQLLSYEMQYFYGGEHCQLVKDFNMCPGSFDYEDVVKSISNSLLWEQSKTLK